jgi:uncharacterized protein (TIGR03435 family)
MSRKHICAALGLAVSLAAAQTQPSARPEFEVASVKPTDGEGGSFGVGVDAANEKNVSLKVMIAVAYRVQDFQITGGPRWLESDRFDVEAKAAGKVGTDQVRLMLQSLLEDRFQLRFHRETRRGPVYALVVAKGGPKLKLSADQTSPDVNGPSPAGAGLNRGVIRLGSGSMMGNAAVFPLFTQLLSQRLERPVVDRTNLKGRYDFQLEWTPGLGENPSGPGGDTPLAAEPTEGRTSIFTALQEQLGLKLESAKGPVEMFVIDRADKPSQN